MFQQAFRSYIASLHPGKTKQEKERKLRSYISILVIWMIFDILSGDRMWEMIYRIIPMFLVKWGNLDGNSYMGKAMYLCPMKYENRKMYINAFLFFKIGVPVFLVFLLEMIWSVMFGFDLERMILLIVIYVSLGIANEIHLDCYDKIDNRILQGRKATNGTIKWAWQNFTTSFVALILLFNCGFSELEGIKGEFYLMQEHIGIVILIILDIVILYTQYSDMIEEAIDYELAFRIPGRLHYLDNQ